MYMFFMFFIDKSEKKLHKDIQIWPLTVFYASVSAFSVSGNIFFQHSAYLMCLCKKYRVVINPIQLFGNVPKK